MTSRTFTPTPPVVRSRGVPETLAQITAQRRAADHAEASLLALAVHLVDLHPVVGDIALAGGATPQRPLRDDPEHLPVAGVGTPEVAELAVIELGAALEVSYQVALRTVAEAVELCYRLPRLWALVQSGRLQAWKARRVAALTSALSRAAVACVDRHTAVGAAHNRLPTHLRALIHEALLQCDPDQAAGVEEAALHRRGVWFDHRDSTATTQLTARLDTLDALELHHTLTDLATSMGRLGDTSSVETRRARALGLLAHPQRALSLLSGTSATEAADAAGGSGGGGGGTGDRDGRVGATVYLHVAAEDLRRPTDGGGRVERLGAATLDLLRDWLSRADGVTVRPVLDLARTDTRDAHDPPGWMREAVVLRDGHCVFPGCTTDARACDLDHIEPYRPPGAGPAETGGPPGQTRSDNLAALCRRHHRLKTLAGWRYRRRRDGQYRWTDPHGRTYAAHPTATGPIPRAP